LIFTSIVATFLFIFRKFVGAFQSYHTLAELKASSDAMSLEERNRLCHEATTATRKSRRAIKKQVRRQQPTEP
jgi:hypothetical protein